MLPIGQTFCQSQSGHSRLVIVLASNGQVGHCQILFVFFLFSSGLRVVSLWQRWLCDGLRSEDRPAWYLETRWLGPVWMFDRMDTNQTKTIYRKRNQHPDPSKLFIRPIASRLTCRPFANNAESKRRSLEILSFISRCIFRRRYFLNVSSLLRNVGTGTPDAEVSIRAMLAPQRVSDTPKFQIGYHLGKAKSLMNYRMPWWNLTEVNDSGTKIRVGEAESNRQCFEIFSFLSLDASVDVDFSRSNCL